MPNLITDVDETVARISKQKGVHGVVILDREGHAIRSTLTTDLTRQYSTLLVKLVRQAKTTVKDLDGEGSDELQLLRVRTKKHEVLLVPGLHLCSNRSNYSFLENSYILIVIQNPKEHHEP